MLLNTVRFNLYMWEQIASTVASYAVLCSLVVFAAVVVALLSLELFLLSSVPVIFVNTLSVHMYK